MVCDCCLRRKKLFESYAAVQTDGGVMNLCVDCNDLAYKIRDDANESNKEKYDEHLKELEKRGKKAKPIFIEWKTKFISPLDKKLKKESADPADTEKATMSDNEKPTDTDASTSHKNN